MKIQVFCDVTEYEQDHRGIDWQTYGEEANHQKAPTNVPLWGLHLYTTASPTTSPTDLPPTTLNICHPHNTLFLHRYSAWTAWARRWRHYSPSKCVEPLKQQHSITS